MQDDGTNLAASLAPLILMGIGFAIGNYFLAKRLGKNQILWAVQSLIPIYNFAFLYYVVYQLIYFMLDRLGEIRAKVEHST